MKIGNTRAGIAKANAAVMLTFAEDRCKDVRIALGSVAPTVIRALMVVVISDRMRGGMLRHAVLIEFINRLRLLP